MNPEPTVATRVAIIGLGLIGGSAAAALTKAGWHVCGYDTHAAARDAALRYGVVQEVHTSLEASVAEVDMVLLAVPVLGILDYLPTLADCAPDGCVIMDMGSTKVDVCAAMGVLPERMSAIGGHPMAGKTTSGVNGPSPDMYRDHVFALVDCPRTNDRARELGARLVDAIGAKGLIISAQDHDLAVAMISHVPHFLSVPMLLATQAMDSDAAWELAAGGFRYTTIRVIDNPPMWRDIALSNGVAIAAALRMVAEQIEKVATVFEAGDTDAVLATLDQAHTLYTNRFGV